MSNSLRANTEIYEKLNYILSEVKSLSHVRLFATPGTVAYQAPPSMGFSRQEYWSGFSKLLMYSSTQEISEHLLYARYCSKTLEVVAINNFFLSTDFSVGGYIINSNNDNMIKYIVY